MTGETAPEHLRDVRRPDESGAKDVEGGSSAGSDASAAGTPRPACGTDCAQFVTGQLVARPTRRATERNLLIDAARRNHGKAGVQGQQVIRGTFSRAHAALVAGGTRSAGAGFCEKHDTELKKTPAGSPVRWRHADDAEWATVGRPLVTAGQRA